MKNEFDWMGFGGFSVIAWALNIREAMLEAYYKWGLSVGALGKILKNLLCEIFLLK